MGIVLPHGVLFRGGVEGTIREELLKKGNIYAVIGLPAGIFFSTGIPTCIVVLKKNNPDRSVFFIDGSKEFRKKRAKNFLDPEHIEKLYTTYVDRKDVEKYAHLATYDEIEKNDFNLNIPRYVDTFEEEELVDIDEVQRNIADIEAELAQVQAQMKKYMDELGI